MALAAPLVHLELPAQLPLHLHFDPGFKVLICIITMMITSELKDIKVVYNTHYVKVCYALMKVI